MKKLIRNFFENDIEGMLYWISIVVILFTALIYGTQLCFVRYTGMYELMECKLKSYTGISCPGCGGTRALKSLLKGNLLKGIYYNAFAIYGAIVYGIFFVTQTLQRITKGKVSGIKFRMVYIWLAVIIILVQYTLRLIIPGYTI